MDELKTNDDVLLYDQTCGRIVRCSADTIKKMSEIANERAREELSDKGEVSAEELEAYIRKELGIHDDLALTYHYTRIKDIATDLAICSDETGIDYDWLSGCVEALVKDEGMSYDEAAARVIRIARRGMHDDRRSN